MRNLILIGVLIVGSLSLSAQTDEVEPRTDARTYSLTGFLIGGYVRDISGLEDTQNDLSINRNQFSVAGRIMWHPGNLLSGGIEGGYMNFYSLKNDEGGLAVRSAVPLYMVFSMTAWDRVDFGLGYGLGILSSTISSETTGNSVVSGTVSTAWFLSAGYRAPISDRFSIGGEVRYSNLDKLDDKTLSASAVLSYRLLDY